LIKNIGARPEEVKVPGTATLLNDNRLVVISIEARGKNVNEGGMEEEKANKGSIVGSDGVNVNCGKNTSPFLGQVEVTQQNLSLDQNVSFCENLACSQVDPKVSTTEGSLLRALLTEKKLQNESKFGALPSEAWSILWNLQQPLQQQQQQHQQQQQQHHQQQQQTITNNFSIEDSNQTEVYLAMKEIFWQCYSRNRILLNTPIVEP
jgi:hypothetical protein